MKSTRLASLWSMMKYEAQQLLGAMSYVGGIVAEWRLFGQVMQLGNVAPPNIPIEHKARFLAMIATLRDSAIRMDMHAAAHAGRQAYDFYFEELASPLPPSAHDLSRWIPPADRLLHSYVAEAEARQFYVMEGKHVQFFADADQLFGPEVVDAFPTIATDVAEAGKCRALGRWTACVMHIMRVLEVGLQHLASRQGVEHSGNWNKTLNEIEAKLRTVQKSVAGAEAERRAAEAGTHLRFVKNAHRNHAMHSLERYDEERAIEIFDSARSFMRHLASELSR